VGHFLEISLAFDIVQKPAPSRAKGGGREFGLCAGEEGSDYGAAVDPAAVGIECFCTHLVVPEAPLASKDSPPHAHRCMSKYILLCVADASHIGMHCIFLQAPHPPLLRANIVASIVGHCRRQGPASPGSP
jgi:hypothetical protein